MLASSRTATADGRKKTSIASSHRPRLARPNWLAAVVSQRNPTIAVMLNSTTSRSRRTRGSWLMESSKRGSANAFRCVSWHRGVDRRHQPADPGAEGGPARDIRGKVLAPGHPQRRDSHGAGDRKSTRLNSSHGYISYAVFCLKKKQRNKKQ